MRSQPYRRASGQLAQPQASLRLPWLVVLFFLAVLVAGFVIAGPMWLAVLETWLQYAFVVPVLLAAAMLGLALTVPLAKRGYFAALPTWGDGYRLLLATALGLGVFSLGTLGLGSLGHLERGLPGVFLVLGAMVGFVPARQFVQRFDREVWKQKLVASDLWVLLAAIPVAVLMVAVTYPPGTLWVSEGRGYDVLEYHLQLPREYLADNTTAPLHHNVYSFLPANVEMLYLLLMSLLRAAMKNSTHIQAIYPAQMLHATLALLAAGAVALAPVRMSKLGRGFAFLVTLAVPWILVTGSLAYNDAGVLLYGALAMGLALRQPRINAQGEEEKIAFSPSVQVMEWVLIGVLLGLAVGCKMTAGVMVAVPVAGVMLARGRWKGVILAAAVAGVIYSPWAIRSWAATGNPVFPLATQTLGRGHWTNEQSQRWDRGHAAPPAQASVTGRLQALAQESLLNYQWSPGIGVARQWLTGTPQPSKLPQLPWWQRVGILWLAVGVGIVVALMQSRASWLLCGVLVVQLLAWLMLTHLQARFLLPALIPLALLIGLALEAQTWTRHLLAGLITLQALACAPLLWAEGQLFLGIQGPRAGLAGLLTYNPQALSMPESIIIDPPNPTLPRPIRTYLLGSSTPLYYLDPVIYHTVFDHDPLIDILQSDQPQNILPYLRGNSQKQTTYLLVDWNEIERLRASYGFASAVNRPAFDALEQLGLHPAPFPTAPGLKLYELPPAP